MSPRSVLALDLGGTQIRAALIRPDGTRVARIASDTPTDRSEAVVAACIEALRRSLDTAPPAARRDVLGIGISAPGPVDPRVGLIVEPPNLPILRDVPLADQVEAAFGLPTFLDRDTNVAALGEAAFGAARGLDDFLYITVSTGIGGGIVSDGKLVHGPDGMAGELGHVPVEMDGPRCGCGGLGHLEAIGSGTAIAREARAAVRAGDSPFLEARAAEVGADELSAKDVAVGEDAGDEACASIMRRARRAVAVACVGFVNTFNPRRIIVGGSIAQHQGDRLLGPVRTAIAEEAFERLALKVEIVPPALGPDVSLAGAHPLVLTRIGDPRWRRARPAELIDLTATATDSPIHASPG
ncbi:MAG: ROK family protein [Chloroflexota bacterium]